jgi:3',5'-cyclic AMP phosphodiesterase CpdA
MAADFNPSAGGANPAFLFHLGDVIYGPGKDDHYGERFYRPYRGYPGKIIAIPGNHDGEAKTAADEPSLKAFRANFCAKAATVPEQAAGSGIFRMTMTQPGIYWLLDAPFVRIIGLYSNHLENPGFLEGRTASGKEDPSQLTWLQKTLTAIGKSTVKKALIIAAHHPPFSQSGHSGSTEMNAEIDAACAAAKVTPDAFLSGHAHNYQRYTRRMGGKEVPYLVIGTGGIGLQSVLKADQKPIPGDASTTYDAAISAHGFLAISVSDKRLAIQFTPVNGAVPHPPDSVSINLATGKLV